MAGHNKQGIRAANEIYQESVKAFALVSFFTWFLDKNVISCDPHLSLHQHFSFFNFKAMGIGLVFKIGFMDPSEAQVKSFYEKQAAASK